MIGMLLGLWLVVLVLLCMIAALSVRVKALAVQLALVRSHGLHVERQAIEHYDAIAKRVVAASQRIDLIAKDTSAAKARTTSTH